MSQDKGKPKDSENANLKEGSPPRPATEPAGAEGGSNSGKTKTDPASGRPND